MLSGEIALKNNHYYYYYYYFNQSDHSICEIDCVPLKGDFSNSTDKLIEEQAHIRKFKTDTHGLSQEIDFVTPYTYCHK